MPPASNGGGGAKYLLVLLILVALGLGAFFAFRAPEAPPPEPKAEPPKVERSTALANDTLEIPEPVPEPVDAGAPKVEEPKKKGPRRVVDSWSCEGDVPAAEIKRILADSQPQVRSCYERQLRNNNLLQGTVNLQVRIGNDGRVASTRVAGSMKDAGVKTCIQGVAKNWSFPAPTGGTCAVFDAPYNFTPKN